MSLKITQTDFAKRKGVTRQTVKEAIDRGKIEVDDNGRIEWESQSEVWDSTRVITEKKLTKAELKKLKEYTDRTNGILAPELQMRLDAGDLTVPESNQIRGILSARTEEIELLKVKGALVDIETVQRDLQNAFAIVRSKVLSLPTKLSIPLESVNDRSKIEKIIKRACIECLEELSAISGKNA